MIQIPVKVSGITSLTDARYCAGMGVQFLGIQFDSESGSAIPPLEFQSIKAWIEGIDWVGEYSGDSVEEVKKLSTEYDLSFWEVSNPELALILIQEGFQVGVKLSHFSVQSKFEGTVSYATAPLSVQFPSEYGNWNNRYPSIPLLISSVSNESDLQVVMHQFPDCGFNFQSGKEERPGWMDLSSLQDLLEKLEEVS